MRTKQEKAQMEILGLSLVMILLVLAGLFAILFLVKPSSSDFSKINDRQKANSLLNAISLVQSDCGDSIANLLKDCATQPNIYCNNGKDSCQYSGEKIKELLDQALPGRNYFFTTEGNNFVEQIRINNPCIGEKESRNLPLLISINFKIDLILEICS